MSKVINGGKLKLKNSTVKIIFEMFGKGESNLTRFGIE